MAELPDDEQKAGAGGEPISQDALDALLAASAGAGEIDDSAAFDSFGQTEESDLNFGLEDSVLGQVEDAAPGEEPGDMFGGASAAFGGMPGAVDFAAFQMENADAYSAPVTENEDFVRVRDIPLDVTVELGRTRLLIKDILDLSSGAIIELDKIAGEPVDLFANGLLVARGEVIVIDDNFGVRITEIITAEDRIKAQYAQSLAA